MHLALKSNPAEENAGGAPVVQPARKLTPGEPIFHPRQQHDGEKLSNKILEQAARLFRCSGRLGGRQRSLRRAGSTVNQAPGYPQPGVTDCSQRGIAQGLAGNVQHIHTHPGAGLRFSSRIKHTDAGLRHSVQDLLRSLLMSNLMHCQSFLSSSRVAGATGPGELFTPMSSTIKPTTR